MTEATPVVLGTDYIVLGKVFHAQILIERQIVLLLEKTYGPVANLDFGRGGWTFARRTYYVRRLKVSPISELMLEAAAQVNKLKNSFAHQPEKNTVHDDDIDKVRDLLRQMHQLPNFMPNEDILLKFAAHFEQTVQDFL